MKKKIVILGAGESGVGAAVLAKDKGYDVFVSDMGTISSHYKEELNAESIPYEEGQHTWETIMEADEVIKSPGIPLTAPIIKELQIKKIPVISEIEFAGRHTNAKMICITGSNGKTTTTMLTAAMLQAAGIDASTSGNIGYSLARQVARTPHDCYVIELSSFQLDNMYDFRANAAVLLNITPDHLDRYDYKFENYAHAKMRIARNQNKDDFFIYWFDDQPTTSMLKDKDGDGTILVFGNKIIGEGASLNDSTIDIELPIKGKTTHFSFHRNDLPLKGNHNLRNAMAASLACLATYGEKASWNDMLNGMRNFSGVEHRLEPAGIINGVTYINDSKATNVDSTFYALGSMTTPTVLIIGGKDKGNDYSQIEDLVKEKVKTLVCMGLHNEKLLDFFKGKVSEIHDTHSLDDAMKVATMAAIPGDTILLSPCCASFDLFNSYEDRGKQFKQWVKIHSH